MHRLATRAQWLQIGDLAAGAAHERLVAVGDPGAAGGNHDQIRVVEAIEVVGDVDRVPESGGDRVGTARDEAEVVHGQPVVGAVEPEHLTGDTEFEDLGAGE